VNEGREQPKTPRRLRRWAFTFFALLALYNISYVALSATGGWVVSESGELRMPLLAVCDTFEWQPRYGECQLFRWSGGNYGLRGDSLGYFYSPLILLDQRYVHRTIRFMRLDGSFVEPLPAPHYSEYHPLRENRFAHRFPYEQRPDDK
jgi:hypothetical protein